MPNELPYSSMSHTDTLDDPKIHCPAADSVLPPAFIKAMRAQFAGIKDVRMSYDLIAMLSDPQVWPNPRRAEMSPEELAALMRILNRDFYSQLHSAECLLQRY